MGRGEKRQSEGNSKLKKCWSNNLALTMTSKTMTPTNDDSAVVGVGDDDSNIAGDGDGDGMIVTTIMTTARITKRSKKTDVRRSEMKTTRQR